MTVLSDAQRNNLALMAYLTFGCTCGSPNHESREALMRIHKDAPDLLFKPLAMALATFHFRECVYEKQKIIQAHDGELEFSR